MEFELLRKSNTRKDPGCETIEIVLRKKKEGKLQPFVTHIHALEGDGYLCGDYFSRLVDANKDFEQRCREYEVMPEGGIIKGLKYHWSGFWGQVVGVIRGK